MRDWLTFKGADRSSFSLQKGQYVAPIGFISMTRGKKKKKRFKCVEEQNAECCIREQMRQNMIFRKSDLGLFKK